MNTPSRSTVEQNNNIDQFDNNDKLSLFSYTNCDNHSDSFIKQCRGLVYDGETLVSRAFPYADEYDETSQELDTILPILPVNASNSDIVVYDAYEGTLIRMFYHDDTWYTSTNHRLNAFRSKWSSKESFGDLFVKALESETEYNPIFASALTYSSNENGTVLEKFQSVLDKSRQHLFLLCSTFDNRIVCDPPSRPTVMYLGYYDKEFHYNHPTPLYGMTVPDSHHFRDATLIRNYVQGIHTKVLQGVIVHTLSGMYKIYNSKWLSLARVRGNEPSIKFRYLQIRQNKEMVSLLMNLYPHMVDAFMAYENVLKSVGTNLYSKYVNRFIKKDFSNLPQNEYLFLKQCHALHVGDRSYKVTLDTVKQLIDQLPATFLNRFIRDYNMLNRPMRATTPIELSNADNAD